MSEEAPMASQEGETDAAPPVFKWDGSRLKDADPSRIEACNFRAPGFLSQSDLQQLGAIHQKFAQHLSARLSTFLRMECGFKITRFNSTSFEKFAAEIASPAYVTLFQIAPLPGIGVLDLSIRLGLAIAERILGGKGNVTVAERSLTEIELALVEDVIQLILAEWARQWEDGGQVFQPQCVGNETSGRFLQTAPADSAVLVIGMEATMGDCVEPVQIVIPFSMIEPVLKKMHGERNRHEPARPPQMQWRSPYDAILVPVTAEWDVREMTVREVIDLQPGHVLEMPRELLAQTRIRFADASEFEGTVGVKSGRVAVQLTKQNRLE